MANIFGPHFANNADQYTRLQVPKLHYKKGTARKDLYYSKLDDLEYLGIQDALEIFLIKTTFYSLASSHFTVDKMLAF